MAPLLALLLLVVPGLSPASATNSGTTSGDHSQHVCEVSWTTSAILSPSLTNDDPEYPGLMVDFQGNPVQYMNGGYISEVSPGLGDDALFEMNHFYVPQDHLQVWRIPTATFDHAVKDASVVFTLPEEVTELGLPVIFDAVSTNGRMALWGAPYTDATWSSRATAINNGDGTWTVDLGDLPRNSGTVYQFNVDYRGHEEAFGPESRFVASATLTGTRPAGEGDCPLPEPTFPDLNETEGQVCVANFYGETLWSAYDGDITRRTKFANGHTGDGLGEVNSDGWGADGWGEGANRTFRLYGATTKPLNNVTYRVTAEQGVTFGTASPAVNSPGHGQLQANGYTAAVEGARVQQVSSTEFLVTIDHMPAMSSFSFNVSGQLDGSGDPMILHHALNGAVADCEHPAPVVEMTDWVNTGSAICTPESGHWVQQRTVTTTRQLWDPEKLEFTPVVEVATEERPRELTDAEREELCPEPGADPSDPPTDPTDPPKDPTTPPEEPSDPPADPTGPPTEPTEPPVKPVHPNPTHPTVPPGQPENPANPGTGRPNGTLPRTGVSSGEYFLFGLELMAAGTIAIAIGRKKAGSSNAK